MPGSAGGSSNGDRAERGRKKTLIVAFHFELSNQAGGRCDVCRRSGLENKRRCGWLAPKSGVQPPGPLVWVRQDVTLTECPAFYVTAESQSLVEEFLVRRRLGAIHIEELSARQVDAFLTLERVLRAEVNHGQQNARDIV